MQFYRKSVNASMLALKGIISSWAYVFIVVPCFKWKVPRNLCVLEILHELFVGIFIFSTRFQSIPCDPYKSFFKVWTFSLSRESRRNGNRQNGNRRNGNVDKMGADKMGQ